MAVSLGPWKDSRLKAMETNHHEFPLQLPAIRIRQTLGDFFAISAPASILLKVAYSNALRVDEGTESGGWYTLEGGQREFNLKRAREIGQYLGGTEAAFPNSIILGANYAEDGEFVDGDPKVAWTVNKNGAAGGFVLTIPTDRKLAAIVDGQHRLGGFKFAPEKAQGMELLCAVYLDLPVPFQAYLFATINFNQKRVDKSLAYELFGFNLDSKHPDTWPPEKLAVFLCRRLNVENGSPFFHRIRVVAENSDIFEGDDIFTVSTATVVEGLLAMFAQKPRLDRDIMAREPADSRSRDQLDKDNSPLRELFLKGQDAVIYLLTKNYFKAVESGLWNRANKDSYVLRTVGVQALFDLLKEIAQEAVDERDISESRFAKIIDPLKKVDFADSFFQASGKGRTRIKNAMRLKLGLVTPENVPFNDQAEYVRVTS